MKTLIFILALCLVTIGATFQTPSRSWEYKFVYQCDEKKTNALANDGWELTDMSMAAYGSMGVATCVFKKSR